MEIFSFPPVRVELREGSSEKGNEDSGELVAAAASGELKQLTDQLDLLTFKTRIDY